MATATIWLVTVLGFTSIVWGQNTFDPGCSFFNGQCVYNVKLGHANQCDSTTKRDTSTSSTGQGSGFQSCSCKDIDNANQNINSLSSQIQTLHSNFGELAKHLNLTQEQLSGKDSDLSLLQTNYSRLSALLADKDYLLNKSQVDLANTVAGLNTELGRLRQELTDSNNQLTVCRTTLGVTNGKKSQTPALYGDFVTHICDFETSALCNYTLEPATSSSTERWNYGLGRQNSQSGPVEDHTFGAPKGHYMFIDPYDKVSVNYHQKLRTGTMTSPEFPPAHNYCVRFWYTMYGIDVNTIKVYAQVGGGNGYPVFTHTGRIDQYWHMVEIGLDSEYTATPFKLVFEGSTDSYYGYSSSGSHSRINHNADGYIAIDDIYVYNTTCKAIPECPAGSRKMTYNNSTSCYTFHVSALGWYDAVQECKKSSSHAHLVSVNSKYEHDFLVDTIENDAAYTTAGHEGWYTSGNDERVENHFKWTASGYPEPLNFTNWRTGQPNNVGDVQNCLLMQYDDARFEWGDVNCADKHPFICEIPL